MAHRYQLTRWGTGFHGRRDRRLRGVMFGARLRLRRVPGPYDINGQTTGNRDDTLKALEEKLRNGAVWDRFVVRGSQYDAPAYTFRKVDTTPPHPLVDRAKTYEGCAYELGAVPPPRADCSGLVLKVVQDVYHYALPHQAKQIQADRHVVTFHDADELRPDDLIFYVYGRLGPDVDHVAFNIDGKQEIGARPSTNGVHVTDIDWPHVWGFGRLKAG